jgi:hypothetical protein
MFRRNVLPASLAIVLGLTATTALADGQKETSRTLMDTERRVDSFEDLGPSRRGSVRMHQHRHGYRHYGHHRHYGYRAWDGRYGSYPRRHFYITGVSGYAVPGLVNVATVSYRTYVYHTPTYPSVSYGYPPYAYVHDLPDGPIYNKPCLC